MGRRKPPGWNWPCAAPASGSAIFPSEGGSRQAVPELAAVESGWKIERNFGALCSRSVVQVVVTARSAASRRRSALHCYAEEIREPSHLTGTEAPTIKAEDGKDFFGNDLPAYRMLEKGVAVIPIAQAITNTQPVIAIVRSTITVASPIHYLRGCGVGTPSSYTGKAFAGPRGRSSHSSCEPRSINNAALQGLDFFKKGGETYRR